MKYWVIDGGEAKGPFEPDELKKLPGFGPSSMIAPDGADRADDWKPASFYLLRPPNPRSEPVEPKPRPAPAPVLEPEPQPAPAPVAAAPAAARSPLLPLILGTAALAAIGGGAYYARRQNLKTAPVEQPPVAAAPAPAPPAPIAKAVPDGDRGGSLPLAVDDAARADALNLTQNFVIVSPAGKYPAGPFDVLAPKRWKAPKTLGELYELRPLEALALEAVAQAQSSGEPVARAAKDIQKDPSGWKDFSEKFLKTAGRVKWDVEPGQADVVRVVAHLRSPRTGAPERRAFDADLKRRTLKPVDFEAWRDLDAKACGNWARASLKIGETPDDAAVAQAAPVYPWSRAKPFKQRKQSPGTRPKALEPVPDEEDSTPEPAQPPEKPLAKAAEKPAPPPGDADEFDPLAAGAQSAPPDHEAAAPQAVEPKPEPAPERAKAAAPPPSDVPDSVAAAPPKPAAKAPETVPPLMDNPPPPQASGPAGDKPANLKTSPGAKKSVTDMSVDELEKYLNRK